MRDDDVRDISKFLNELNRETDRGLPLVCAALIDDRLRETLRSFFCECRTAAKLLDIANAPLGTLSARAQCCYVLSLIDDDEYADIEIIRKIRNEFAHAKHGTSFQSDRVKALCGSLCAELPKGLPSERQTDPRFQFINAAVGIVLRLYYRPEWVARERRTPKSWDDGGRWHAVEDELPPLGVPIVVLGKKHP